MPIAKNANTTLKRLFVQLSGHPDRDRILAGDVHSYLASHKTGLRLEDYSFAEAQDLMKDDSYFRFAVLRNPLARATSGYLSKFVWEPQFEQQEDTHPDVICQAIDWVYAKNSQSPDYRRSITFTEFVDYLASNGDHDVDTHYRSQSSYLEGVQYDCIAVQENLAPLVAELESRFGQPVELEHCNAMPGGKVLAGGWRAARQLPSELRTKQSMVKGNRLLTSQLKQKLKRRFARDVELWEQASGTSL